MKKCLIVVDYQNEGNDIIKVGDKISTYILKFNPSDKRISLSVSAYTGIVIDKNVRTIAEVNSFFFMNSLLLYNFHHISHFLCGLCILYR